MKFPLYSITYILLIQINYMNDNYNKIKNLSLSNMNLSKESKGGSLLIFVNFGKVYFASYQISCYHKI
jgi:hypothetical protein